MTKKLNKTTEFEDMDFLERINNAIGIDPKEIQREKEKIKLKIAKVDENVKKTEESIKQGARRSKHKFSL